MPCRVRSRKTAEPSAGRTVGWPSIGRRDGKYVVTTAHVDTLVLYAMKMAEQSHAVSRGDEIRPMQTANEDGQQSVVITGVASCCLGFHSP